MQRLHINLPEDVHVMLREMCENQVRNVSSQIQFLIKEANGRANGGYDRAVSGSQESIHYG